MLTPRDIHQAEFKRVWKGYSTEEVDDFLRRVVTEYESLYKENQSLKKQVDELQGEVEQYASTHTQVSETLDFAKQSAADLKQAARNEAESALARAKGQANEIVAAARREAEEKKRQLQYFLDDLDRFQGRTKKVLREFISYLEDSTVPTIEKAPALEVAAGLEDSPSEDSEVGNS